MKFLTRYFFFFDTILFLGVIRFNYKSASPKFCLKKCLRHCISLITKSINKLVS